MRRGDAPRRIRVYILSGGTHRIACAARNLPEAARKIGVTAGFLRRHGGRTLRPDIAAIVGTDPSRVWAQRIASTPQPWLYALTLTGKIEGTEITQ